MPHRSEHSDHSESGEELVDRQATTSNGVDLNLTQDTNASHVTSNTEGKGRSSGSDSDASKSSAGGSESGSDDEETQNLAQTTATEFEPYSGGKSSPDDVSKRNLRFFSAFKKN